MTRDVQDVRVVCGRAGGGGLGVRGVRVGAKFIDCMGEW